MPPSSRMKERNALMRNRQRRNQLWSHLPDPSEVPVILVLGESANVAQFLNAASSELNQPEPLYDESSLVERDGIPMAFIKHAQLDAHTFSILGIDTTCLHVRSLVGSWLARECYVMTVIALLFKHKIRFLGIVCCFDLTDNTIERFTSLTSTLVEQSFSNVCVAFPAQTSVQDLPISPQNPDISKRIQQGWKFIAFDGSRGSVLQVILSVVQPEQTLPFRTKLIDEDASLSVVGGWSDYICDSALSFRGTSFDEDIFWDFQSSMNEATSKLLKRDATSLGTFAKTLLGDARSAGEHSTDALRNVAVTALHFNDLLAVRRAVFDGGLVYKGSGTIAYGATVHKPAAVEATQQSITAVKTSSESSARRSAIAQEPNVVESLSHLSVEGSASPRKYIYYTSRDETKRTPPPIPPRLRADGSRNATLNVRSHATINTLTISTSEPYSPLKDSQIRLVKLLAGRESEKIQLSLNVVDLVALPQFEALSYVVGQRDNSRSVGIAHRGTVTPFSISKTLETVLLTLRREDRERVLWIDAISINQRDPAERSAQIKKMSQIFHAATSVCIWLGPASREEQSDDAIEFIPKVLDFTTLDLTLKDRANKPRWLALSRLMARDWWQRRWMVQEMALARTAIVYCGSSQVLWSDFAAAADIFESRWLEIREALGWESAEELGDVHIPGASSLVRISNGVFQKDSLGNIQRRCYDLETLIAILPIFAVTEPLDFVYSILSLGRDTYDVENLSIPLDYSLSPKKVFVSVVQHIIDVSDSLDVICRPWAANGSLPSWIPTVDMYAYTRRNDGQYERENADSLVGLPGRPIYSASGRRSYPEGVRVEWVVDEPRLLVRGYRLGMIQEVGDRCVNGNIPRDWHSMGQWDRNQSQVPDAYWRTLVADRGLHGEPPPAWFGEVCTHCFKQNTLRDVDTSRLMRRLKSSHAKELLRQVQVTIWNRRLFQASTWPPGKEKEQANLHGLPSSVLGLGPAETRVGDSIVILQGCSVPVILRRSAAATSNASFLQGTDRWVLIGACFVHGQMDGEFSFERSYGQWATQYRLV